MIFTSRPATICNLRTQRSLRLRTKQMYAWCYRSSPKNRQRMVYETRSPWLFWLM
jgi:hypothetical protein